MAFQDTQTETGQALHAHQMVLDDQDKQAHETSEAQNWQDTKTGGKGMKKQIQNQQMTQEQIDHLVAMERNFKRQQEIMDELLVKQPGLGFIPAFIMSGDMASAERVEAEFNADRMDFERAFVLMGSYARFDFLVRVFEAGKLSQDKFYKMLPSEWSAADPDDTDPRFLKIWLDAWEHQGTYLRDKKALRKRGYFTIWHGQDRSADKIGIAWSLDRYTAGKFARGAWARQSDRDGIVLEGHVHKDKVLGYITGRGEEEIIVNPQDVFEIQKHEIKE